MKDQSEVVGSEDRGRTEAELEDQRTKVKLAIYSKKLRLSQWD